MSFLYKLAIGAAAFIAIRLAVGFLGIDVEAAGRQLRSTVDPNRRSVEVAL